MGGATEAGAAPPPRNEQAPTKVTQNNMTAEQIEQHLSGGHEEAGVRRPRDPAAAQNVPPPKPATRTTSAVRTTSHTK
eukprot:3149575-Prymnesium_polylepis.1